MAETLIACEGGLDLRSAPINAPKGTLSVCYNFEKDQGPGYVKRLGWCRYDGRVQGPEHDAALVIQFAAVNLTGVFQYGEQVRLNAAGYGTLTGICIGFQAISLSGMPPFLVLAYPVTSFTNMVDPAGFPNTTNAVGLTSGAVITAISGSKLMNDSSLTIPQYDLIKNNIQYNHSAAVKVVPGRNESPVDCNFTFSNNSYAIHDCVIFTFTNGTMVGTTVGVPLEGHCIRSSAGPFIGRILNLIVTNGDWGQGGVTGSFIIYDYPIGQAFPAGGVNIDIYDASNSVLIKAGFARFGSAAAGQVTPSQTRALLYQTYEQFVKDVPVTVSSPITTQLAPPTWTRPRLGRELPYTCVGGATLGFGPAGGAPYSVYEYSRQGLTQQLGAISPQTTTEQACTIATDSNVASPHWVNPNNIKVQDGANATYNALAAGLPTSFLQAQAFDWSTIPAGSTILGIQVRLHWNNSVTANTWIDETVSLMGANFPQGRGLANYALRTGPVLAAAYSDFNYGGAGDTWGAQLTVAQLQDPSFGVFFRFQRIAGGGGGALPQIDFVGMTVTYAAPTRTVYVRDPAAVTVTDIIANVIDYQIDTGDFLTSTAVGVLTVQIGLTESLGTAAGKSRRIGKGNEIRDAPSTGANVPHGNLLAFAAGEDYPISFPASAALDAVTSRYEVIDANFWDLPNARAAFMVNGVEYCVMFDGTYFVRIHTGRSPQLDCPRHVAQHGSPTPYLYLGFQSGSLSNTGAGHPTHYIGVPNSTTFVFGEPCTGLLSVNGQTLGVWTDHSTRGLQGNDPTQATPIMISPAINCIEYTLVNLVGEAVWTSYRGVETLRTVQAYGDFETLPLSAAAQLWLQPRIQVDSRIGNRPSRALYAIGIRNKRQYRIFFEDGYYFCLTLFDAGDLPVCTTGRMIRPNVNGLPEGNVLFPFNNEPWNSAVVRHVFNGTRSDGKELIFACFENQYVGLPAADGTNIGPYFPYVARMDCGYNDDQLPTMPCFIEFNSFYAGHPAQMQQWDGGTIIAQAYGGTVYTIYTKLDYDGPIFDTANNSPLVTAAPVIDVYKQNQQLPLIEAQAYIPVPSRPCIFNVSGEGRSLKMRIDATQNQVQIMPVRITHINLTTVGEAIPGA